MQTNRTFSSINLLQKGNSCSWYVSDVERYTGYSRVLLRLFLRGTGDRNPSILFDVFTAPDFHGCTADATGISHLGAGYLVFLFSFLFSTPSRRIYSAEACATNKRRSNEAKAAGLYYWTQIANEKVQFAKDAAASAVTICFYRHDSIIKVGCFCYFLNV